MPTNYARGITRQIVLAPETSFGVQSSGIGQILRRTSFSMDPSLPEIQSQEITEHAMLLDQHVGVPSAPASLSGQLSPGTYKSLFEALLRGTWTAGVSLTGIADSVLGVNGTTGVVTLTAPAENFLTAGFKIGDTVAITGLTGGVAGLNNVRLHITGLAATTMTFAPDPAAAAYASGQTISVAVLGKKVFTPLVGAQVDRSFSIEDYQPSTGVSNLGLGLKPTQISIGVQPSGFVSFSCSMIGKTVQVGSTQVFPSPTDQSTSLGANGAVGMVLYNGTVLGYVTAANIQLSVQAQPVPAIGSTAGVPAIFMGMIASRGTLSMLTVADTVTSDFLQETDVDLKLYLPSAKTAATDFISIYQPRVRMMSTSRQDSDRAIMRSVSFGAMQKTAGGAGTPWDATLLTVQDTLA